MMDSSYIDSDQGQSAVDKDSSQTKRVNGVASAAKVEKEIHPAADNETIDRMAFHLEAIMQTLQLQPEQETTHQTSLRVAKYFLHDLLRGLNPAYKPDIQVLPNEGQAGQMVLERNVSFRSYCQRYSVPFTGKAHIAYYPNENTIDSSGLHDLVDFLARKPHTQERLTEEIAVKLARYLQADDVAIILEAEHFGIEDGKASGPTNSSVTSSYKGCFQQKLYKEEFLFSVQNQ